MEQPAPPFIFLLRVCVTLPASGSLGLCLLDHMSRPSFSRLALLLFSREQMYFSPRKMTAIELYEASMIFPTQIEIPKVVPGEGAICGKRHFQAAVPSL